MFNGLPVRGNWGGNVTHNPVTNNDEASSSEQVSRSNQQGVTQGRSHAVTTTPHSYATSGASRHPIMSSRNSGKRALSSADENPDRKRIAWNPASSPSAPIGFRRRESWNSSGRQPSLSTDFYIKSSRSKSVSDYFGNWTDLLETSSDSLPVLAESPDEYSDNVQPDFGNSTNNLVSRHGTSSVDPGSPLADIGIVKQVADAKPSETRTLILREVTAALSGMRENLNNMEPLPNQYKNVIDLRDWKTPPRSCEDTWNERLDNTEFMLDSIAKAVMLEKLKEHYDDHSFLNGDISDNLIDEMWEKLTEECEDTSFLIKDLFNELIEEIQEGHLTNSADKTMLGHYVDGQPMGLLIMSDTSPPFINDIVSRPDSKGVGSALIEQAVQISDSLDERGIVTLWPLNDASRKAYEAWDFIELPSGHMSLNPAESEKWCRRNDEWKLKKHVEDK